MPESEEWHQYVGGLVAEFDPVQVVRRAPVRLAIPDSFWLRCTNSNIIDVFHDDAMRSKLGVAEPLDIVWRRAHLNWLGKLWDCWKTQRGNEHGTPTERVYHDMQRMETVFEIVTQAALN